MSKRKIIFIVSLVITILCFFTLNKIIYNHPLGAHSFQVVDDFSLTERLLKSWKFLNELKNNLLKHFPVVYFAIAISIISIFRINLRLKPVIVQFLLISGLFLLIVPILIPSDGGKQWGPRFVLFLIPMFTVIAICNLDKIWKIKRMGLRYIIIAGLTCLFILGFNINMIEGTETSYQKGKAENLEVLNFLRQDNHKFIAVANQYVAQSFVATFKEKIFFLAKQPEQVSKLGLALYEQGTDKFLYICPVYDKCFYDNKLPNQLELSTNNQKLTLRINKIRENKRYRIEEAKIIKLTQNK